MLQIVITLLMIAVAVAPAQTLFGRRAPGFSLPDVTLKQHDLQDYRGKVVVIDFMKTDCPHCQELTKTLEQVKAKYGEKIQILSVVNPPDNQTTVKRYMATYNATNPFLFDCGQMTASFLQITPKNPSVHLPHIVVVDRNGMIRRDLAETAANLANINAAIDPLLK